LESSGFVGKTITIFLAIIIAVVLTVVIADLVVGITGTTSNAQAVDISSARITSNGVTNTVKFYMTYYPYAGGVTLKNSTGGTVAGTEYTFVDAGKNAYSYITLVNGTYWTTDITNSTTLTYNYNQLGESWSRSVLNIALGFVAMAILGIGIAYLYSMYKDTM
jgi:hypothetical protein